MNIRAVAAAFTLLALTTATAKAQDDKKEKVPVYNYVIDDPMDAFGRQPAVETVVFPVSFPDFYSYVPRMSKDTIFRYECYDSHRDLIAIDSLRDNGAIRYISLIKSFTDPAHTYIDAKGKEQHLPVAKIIYRYDRIAENKWMSVDYSNNKSTFLVELKNSTSRTDTSVIVNTSTNVTTKTVHKYYKVIPEKS